MDPLLQLGALAGALTAIVTAIYFGGRWMLRTMRKLNDFLEDWGGEPARSGVPARLGVMDRLARIEAQLRPNGGSTLRDAVTRIEQSVSGDHPPR